MDNDTWEDFSSDNLPPAGVLVWAQREWGTYSEIVLAYRSDKPISTNPDPSYECYWWGRKLDQGYGNIDNNKWSPKQNFSDVTVKRWAYLEPPKPIPHD